MAPALKGLEVRRSAGRHQPMKAGSGWVSVQCPHREQGCEWTTTRPDKPGYVRSAELKHSYECPYRPRFATGEASIHDLSAYRAATAGQTD